MILDHKMIASNDIDYRLWIYPPTDELMRCWWWLRCPVCRHMSRIPFSAVSSPQPCRPSTLRSNQTTKMAMLEAVERGNMISRMCRSSSRRHCFFLLTKPLGFWTSNCMLAGIPSHFVCFPVTETGLCTNTSVVLSLQTERTTSKPSGADTNTFPSRWSTQPQPPASPFSCLW